MEIIVKASDLFVKALEKEGVEYIFGVPGEENLDFLNSLKDSKIKLILTRHEQGAGFMAATYGRLTGNVGVCLATLGPGATNLVTPAAYAQLGAMPMLMITGQKPIKSSKQGQFQIINVIDMMRPLTKYTHQIVNGNNIASRVREAVRLAQEERPGAVHLELPEDIAAEDAEEIYLKESYVRRPIAEAKAVDEAVQMIQQAKRPLVLVGAAANRKMTSKALREFIDKTGIFFFDTQMGKGVLDGRHSQYLGNAALSDHDYVHCAIERADLIINVGHDVIEKPPFFMHQEDLKKVIHINFLSASVDPVYFPQVEVVGDVAKSIEAMTQKITQSKNWDFDYFKRAQEALKMHLCEDEDNNSFPVIPQKFVADVRKAIPEDGIIALDNGVYKVWFARNYPAYQQNTVLLDNALATMGAGLPSAMAAKLLYPGRKVLAICGDGGFMMNSQEIETSMRLGLDLVVLVLNDGAYGMIKWKQAGMGFENWGLDFGNPDFVKYAESYGAHGVRINKAEEFLPVLEECLNSKGVHLIDLPVDYSENEAVLTEQMKTRTCLI